MIKPEVAVNYCEALYQTGALYIWRFNGEIVTSQNIQDHYHAEYHANPHSEYDANYYTKKYQQAMAKGQCYGADCSGMFYKLSGGDNTAQGYYNTCTEKGTIDKIDKSKVCLVFKGTPMAIHHIGLYCGNGYTIEMESSDTNCIKRELSKGNWNFYGCPSWIDYSSSNSNTNNTNTDTKPVSPTVVPNLIKCVDVSAYNQGLDYKQMKQTGVQQAIIKFMRKDLQKDKMFETHYKGFLDVGIKINGFYTYTYASTFTKAISDATEGIKNLADKKGKGYKVWLDVEDECMKNLGSGLITICNAVQKIYEEAGFEFGIYTGQYFYNTFFKPYINQCTCPISHFWVAKYYKGDVPMNFSENPNQSYIPVQNIYGWQYTSCGYVNGYNKRIDLSVIYSDVVFEKYNKTITNDTKTNTDWKETVQECLCIVHDANALRERSTPDSTNDNNTVGILKNGAIFQTIAVTSNGWWKVKDSVYVSGKYSRPVVGTVINCNAVFVHENSDTKNQNDRKGTLKVNETCSVRRKENDAYLINTSKGLNGYVSAQFIKLS